MTTRREKLSNAKWFVFGLCFLAVMAALGVVWVEQKIAQVTGVVNGAVTSVKDTVNAPLDAVSQWFRPKPDPEMIEVGKRVLESVKKDPSPENTALSIISELF